MMFLPASQRAAHPWKNGGGVTRDVAIHPRAAGMDAFDWRVSIAEVASDGPFSLFPEIDRTLAILSGDGIALEIDGQSHELLPGRPFAFAGDRPASARLLGGPVTDLNVMSRRGKVTHRVTALMAGRILPVKEGVLVWISGIGSVGGYPMGPLDAMQVLRPGEWIIEGHGFLAYYAAFTRL